MVRAASGLPSRGEGKKKKRKSLHLGTPRGVRFSKLSGCPRKFASGSPDVHRRRERQPELSGRDGGEVAWMGGKDRWAGRMARTSIKAVKNVTEKSEEVSAYRMRHAAPRFRRGSGVVQDAR